MLKNFKSFVRMKYQMWLMRQLDKQDLTWYHNEKIEEVEDQYREKIWKLKDKVCDLEEKVWNLEDRVSDLICENHEQELEYDAATFEILRLDEQIRKLEEELELEKAKTLIEP